MNVNMLVNGNSNFADIDDKLGMCIYFSCIPKKTIRGGIVTIGLNPFYSFSGNRTLDRLRFYPA